MHGLTYITMAEHVCRCRGYKKKKCRGNHACSSMDMDFVNLMNSWIIVGAWVHDSWFVPYQKFGPGNPGNPRDLTVPFGICLSRSQMGLRPDHLTGIPRDVHVYILMGYIPLLPLISHLGCPGIVLFSSHHIYNGNQTAISLIIPWDNLGFQCIHYLYIL